MTMVLMLLVVGLAAGFLARLLVPGKTALGIPATALLGVSGSYLAAFVNHLRGTGEGQVVAGFLGTVVGATVLLAILRLFMERPWRLFAHRSQGSGMHKR